MLRFVSAGSRVGLGIACALAFALAPATASAAHVVRVVSDHPDVDLGARLEVRVELDRAYDNPFDPAEIQVDALVATPSGAVLRVPAFWDRDVSRALVGDREVLTAQGTGFFHVRFAPLEEGPHELTVVARDADGEDVSAATVFDVGSGDARGFVHVDPIDPMALAYDDGTPYVPVGVNLCWSSAPSAGYDMEQYLGELGGAGGNWSRLWLTHFGEGWTLEWTASHPSGYYAGLGRYSTEVASRLDRVFEVAESQGIAIQLVLWQHSQFETENWSSWTDNPYNQANGGPAADSQAFFESPVALELSQRRLRYLVGRYSAYRSLLAWEVMNEADGVHAPSELVSSWCDARARELRRADPYRHLVTVSHLVRPYLATAATDASDAYDMTQSHAYGGAFGFSIPKDVEALRAFGKPMVFGEFGLDYLGEVDQSDPRGVHLSEGAWLAMASGFWGGAMSWWWDSYVRPNDLWATLRGLATFTRAVDLRGMHEPLPEGISAEDPSGRALDVFGRRGSPGAVLYVRDPDARWEIAATAGVPSVGGGRASVPCDTGRTCTVRAFDTQTGVQSGPSVDIAGDVLGLGSMSLPPFLGSIALEVRPAVPPPMDPQRSEGVCSVGAHAPGGDHAWWGAVGLAVAFEWGRRRVRRSAGLR